MGAGIHPLTGKITRMIVQPFHPGPIQHHDRSIKLRAHDGMLDLTHMYRTAYWVQCRVRITTLRSSSPLLMVFPEQEAVDLPHL